MFAQELAFDLQRLTTAQLRLFPAYVNGKSTKQVSLDKGLLAGVSLTDGEPFPVRGFSLRQFLRIMQDITQPMKGPRNIEVIVSPNPSANSQGLAKEALGLLLLLEEKAGFSNLAEYHCDRQGLFAIERACGKLVVGDQTQA